LFCFKYFSFYVGFFSSFNATQRYAEFALRAVKAYQQIVDALEGARDAAVNASNAADIAYKKVRTVGHCFNCRLLA
jgi:beta-glucosidase/6-phospho-beta-glucosidase/beta-galactosidase